MFQSAMEYVFGSTFICKTTDAAKEVHLDIFTNNIVTELQFFDFQCVISCCNIIDLLICFPLIVL